MDSLCNTIFYGPIVITAKTIHHLIFSRHFSNMTGHNFFILCQKHSTFRFAVLFDLQISRSSLKCAQKRLRARRRGLPCAYGGQWVRGAARARAERSRRRWLPAHRQAGPSYLAQGKARHVRGNFAILCIEGLDRMKGSMLRSSPLTRIELFL